MNKAEGLRRLVTAMYVAGALLTAFGVLAFLMDNPLVIVLGLALLAGAWIVAGFAKNTTP